MTAMDRAWLSAWLDEAWLTGRALGDSRAAFTERPDLPLVLQTFLRPELAARLGRFVHEEAAYSLERKCRRRGEPVVDEEMWASLPDDQRLYQIHTLRGPIAGCRLSENVLGFLHVAKAFRDPRMRGLFEALTGVALHASDFLFAKAMRAGDFIYAHTDRLGQRRFAVTLFVTEGWRREFGGLLCIADARGARHSVDCVFNSLVLFDVNATSEHYVTPVVASPDNRQRCTVGGWFHEGERDA
jgi:2-oxoglutarate-Fe(II)-dependent oxygenase superfamily protein